ncbi:MAG: radical SAM protein [Pseudomonadota bacterium]
MRPQVLLINPWIYDFAAFDLWARPLGLLYLAAWLKKAGCDVRLVDCLDRLHPRSGAPPRRRIWPRGTGKWARQPVPTPGALSGLPRRYCRYGLPLQVFREDLAGGPRPDLVLVTCGMTYWYPGAKLAIAQAREVWPEATVILGGVYPTLCPDHARKNSGADMVVSGPAEKFLPRLGEMLGLDLGGPAGAWFPSHGVWPALDLYPRLEYAPLMTSRGCPYNCPYCASNRLFQGFMARDPEDVLAEIADRRHRLGLVDFAFFDDALLLYAPNLLAPVLEEVIRRGYDLRFHAPNGLHVGAITPELARLMAAAGFESIRLGLESLDQQRQATLGGKVETGGFEAAVGNLISAGFRPDKIGVYVLFGLPGQPLEEVLGTIRTVKALGTRPYLTEYSPLPGTRLWSQAVRSSPFDLENEPLYHNNTNFPCRGPDFSWEKVWEIKRQAVK